MKRDLICIICPKGCALCAQISGEQVTVTGNTCPKGQEYATQECLRPMRTVTATVRVSNRHNTMVSVKTREPVPKEGMQEVMAALRAMCVQAPLSIGQTVIPGLLGTDVVVTKAVE